MYTAMCICDFNSFKKGEFYDAYQESQYAFLRKEDTNTDFERIHINDYRHYFEYITESILVQKKVKVKRFLRADSTDVQRKWYTFDNLELKYLRKIQLLIFLPILLMKDETILEQFSYSIHYSLQSLEELCKMPALVNLDTEIERIGTLMSEIFTLYEEINGTSNTQVADEVKKYLNKHHDLMDQIIATLKQISSASQT